MAKKKAAVKKGTEKAVVNESLSETQDTHPTSLEPNFQPYVVIEDLKKSKVGGDTVAKFTAIVFGDAAIANFAFDLQLNHEFPDIIVIDPSDDSKRAIVRCWFYSRSVSQGAANLLGDPEDDLVVVVVNSRKFKNFQA
jgi:hypothetical protein